MEKMKKHFNFRCVVAISLTLSILFTGTSCDKEPVQDRPELPPMESLFIDFSDFSEQPVSKKSTAASYDNFLHAYLSVFFWNVATTVKLALPVVAYGYALEQDAEYLGDNTWEWSFDFPFGDKEYTATLTGIRLNNDEFSMDMVISPVDAPEEGVKWFDGVVRYDHTFASWNLYKQGSVKVIEAEWNKDYETEAADITYTYVEEGHEQEGSYIMFQYKPGEIYDAAYTISLADGEVFIQWNTETKEGRVKDFNKYEDNEWHCWDTLDAGLADKVCE
jgi:hypothetical protein